MRRSGTFIECRTENSGPQGAAHISAHLLERYGKDSFEFIIDEGGSEVKDLYGAIFALPGTAEKVIFRRPRLRKGISGCDRQSIGERRSFFCSARTYNHRTTRTDCGTD